MRTNLCVPVCVCVCACVTAEVSTLFTHKEGNDVHYETDGVRHHTASKFKHYNRSPDEFAMGLLNLKKKEKSPNLHSSPRRRVIMAMLRWSKVQRRWKI